MSEKSKPESGAGFAPLDLFGDPVPDNWMKRGRPPHVKTAENRQKVLVGLALGWTQERLARGLRITQATLRKHYSMELRQADQARDALVLAHRHGIVAQALAGNVGALKQLGQMIEKHGLDGMPPKPPSEAPRMPAPWQRGAGDLGDGDVAGSA